MNIEKRFLDICAFIKEHKELIQTEVLELYPFVNLNKYFEWTKSFDQFSEAEMICLENENYSKQPTHHNYQQFLSKINELLDIPKLVNPEPQKIPSSLKRKLSLKKQHELHSIKPVISLINPSNLVDVGSGAGHLSSFLVHEDELKSLCIDMNKNYQQIGIDKLKKYSPKTLEKLKFKTLKVNPKTLNDLNIENSCLIGLHACGDLSVSLIQSFNKPQFSSLLSLGCCYHKLSKPCLNISSLAKKEGINLTNQALTMASKSYKSLDLVDYNYREKVKSYRYTIHLLMQEKLGIEFKTLGNAKRSDYLDPFILYVRKYLPEAHKLSDKEIDSFYHEKRNVVKNIMNFGIIRSQLARVVELYLILDRSLYLSEKNITVEVLEIFEKKISPRNYAIKATQN